MSLITRKITVTKMETLNFFFVSEVSVLPEYESLVRPHTYCKIFILIHGSSLCFDVFQEETEVNLDFIRLFFWLKGCKNKS